MYSLEKGTRWQYQVFNWLINVLLVLQAALSAVFVALGAAENHYQRLLSRLGAVNGVLIAVLAIIKGQGLPAQFCQYANGLRGVMDEFIKLEAEFEISSPVTRRECQDLRNLYGRLQDEYAANSPEISRIDIDISSSSRNRTSGQSPQSAHNPPPGLSSPPGPSLVPG